MLGSLIRLLVFATVVAAATWLVATLLETEGTVTVAVAGYEYALTPLAAAGLLVIASAGLWVVVRLVDLVVALVLFILGDPAAVRRFTDDTRKRRGVETLDATLMALARGDPKAALKNARKTERLLRRPGLTRLLMAQSAELAGDGRRARRYWRALAEEPQTAIVGLKGLLAQAEAAGDADRALALAEQAAEISPTDRGVLETLYQLQSSRYDWAGARATLATQRRIGAVPRAEADTREAALALAQAEEADLARDRAAAKRHALEAVRLDPSNAQAAAAAARQLAREGQKRAAAKHLAEAWRREPSAEIARAFAEIEPEESAEARRRRFDKLFAANPEHRETQFVRAELALLARDWAGARAALDALGETELSARSCAIMAAIARGEGEPEAVVRGWLAKALGAPRPDGAEGEIGEAAMLPLLVDDDPAPAAEVDPAPEPPRAPPSAETPPDISSAPEDEARPRPA